MGPYGNVYSSHKKHLHRCGLVPSHCIPEPESGWPFLGLFQIRNRRAELIKNIPYIKSLSSHWPLNTWEFKVGVFSLWLRLSLYGCNHLSMCMPFLFFFFGKHAGLVKLFLWDRLSFNVRVCLSCAKEKWFKVPLKCV